MQDEDEQTKEANRAKADETADKDATEKYPRGNVTDREDDHEKANDAPPLPN